MYKVTVVKITVTPLHTDNQPSVPSDDLVTVSSRPVWQQRPLAAEGDTNTAAQQDADSEVDEQVV